MENTILVVDDDSALRDMAALVIREAGYDVDEATCGTDALAKLTSGTYGMALLDVMMPDMTGLQVLKAIEGTPAGETPIVLFSASYVGAIPNGAVAILEKPCRMADLLGYVRRYAGEPSTPATEEKRAG